MQETRVAGLPTRPGCLTRGCRGSQVGSEPQSHVSKGTSASPRKMLRPRLSRCHTDRLSTRPWSSACGTEYWGQEVRFSGALLVARVDAARVGWGGSYRVPTLKEFWGAPKGINGGLDYHHAHHKADTLENDLIAPRRSSGLPLPPRPAGRGVLFINGEPHRGPSLTRRVSLKTGFRFRFFTAVLRLLCLSGRR